MASPNPNFGQLESSTLQKWLNDHFSDQIFNGLPLFAWMNKNGRKNLVDGGSKLLEPLMYDRNKTNKWMSPGGYDSVDISAQNGLTSAEFNWKSISGAVTMSRFEKSQNMGKSQIINLWDTKIEQEKISLQDKFNTDLYSDGSTDSNNAITGLGAMITTTGTYGNISRSANSWWQAIVDSTAAVLSQDQMRTQYNNQSKNVTHPTICLTSQTLYEKYESLLLPAYRIEDRRMGDLGFDSLQFKGVPIVYDDACGSTDMFFLNDNYLGLQVHSQNDFYWTETRNPVTQFVDTMLCFWMGNLTCSNSRFQGKLTAKTAN